MKIALVTDAWPPQVHAVVSTLQELVRALQVAGHEVVVIHPGQFRSRPCPGVPGLALALLPGRHMAHLLDAADADAIHIATEGPLGWAARRHCLRRGWPFSTAFHSHLPEWLHRALHWPLAWGYGLLRLFHRPSSGVMVPSAAGRLTLARFGFRNIRGWMYGVDTRLFAYAAQARAFPGLGPLAHPVSLFVGRLSDEKNVEAFLALDVPGSKIVCGAGPLEDQLGSRYPNVHWMGLLPRHELAKVYAAADVLVFPGQQDAFGAVMLEAMACGTPVAAFPVEGARQLLGDSGAGAMHADLAQAWQAALRVPRHLARQRAQQFAWSVAAQRFADDLVLLPRKMRKKTGA